MSRFVSKCTRLIVSVLSCFDPRHRQGAIWPWRLPCELEYVVRLRSQSSPFADIHEKPGRPQILPPEWSEHAQEMGSQGWGSAPTSIARPVPQGRVGSEPHPRSGHRRGTWSAILLPQENVSLVFARVPGPQNAPSSSVDPGSNGCFTTTSSDPQFGY